MNNYFVKHLSIFILFAGILLSCNDENCGKLEKDLVGTWFAEGPNPGLCNDFTLEINIIDGQLFIDLSGSEVNDFHLANVDGCKFEWTTGSSTGCYPNTFCKLIGVLKGDQLEISALGEQGSVGHLSPRSCDFIFNRQ